MQLTGMEILELKEEIGEKEKDFLAKEKELNWLYETSMAEASGNIKASRTYMIMYESGVAES